MPNYIAIPGYEGLYEISEDGDIRSVDRIVKHGHSIKRALIGKPRKTQLDKDGYPVLKLSKDGIKAHYGVHRLVAIAWIDNPDGLPEVNHINGIKTDCRKVNLEWVSVSGNAKHAYKMGLRKSNWLGKGSMTGRFGAAHNQAKAVVQLTMSGEIVRTYSFIKEAKKYGFQPTHIGACAKGKEKHHRGFKWKYIDSPLNIAP